jgi:hypothetical protein
MGKRKVIETVETVETFEDPWDKLDEPVVYPEPAPWDPDDRRGFRAGEDGWFYVTPSVNDMKEHAANYTIQDFIRRACIRRMTRKELLESLRSEHSMFRKM